MRSHDNDAGDWWADELVAAMEKAAWRSSLKICAACLVVLFGLAVLVYVSGQVLRP